jgi:hypothetical protein
VAVRLVLWWVVCWLLLVLESREMLPLKPPEFVPKIRHVIVIGIRAEGTKYATNIKMY